MSYYQVMLTRKESNTLDGAQLHRYMGTSTTAKKKKLAILSVPG